MGKKNEREKDRERVGDREGERGKRRGYKYLYTKYESDRGREIREGRGVMGWVGVLRQ